MESEALALTLPIRRLVEFLLRTGSIDSRFTGFDRALEGARVHRKLQRAAVKEYPDYQAEAALKQDYACAQITYTLEGRADGIFTDTDGMPTIDEIKTTTLPPELITGEQSPEHWAQAQIYAAIYARQNGLPAMRVRLTYFQVDEELEFRFSHDYTADALDAVVTDLLTQYAPWAKAAHQPRVTVGAAISVSRLSSGPEGHDRRSVQDLHRGRAVALPGTHRHRQDDECAVPGVKGCGAGRPCLLPDGPRYDPCGSGERAGAAAGVRRPSKAAQRNADRQGQNLYAGSARVYARGMPLCQRIL